jgi:hypothetical protein
MTDDKAQEMRKVVINVCFGGFGLSEAAVRQLIGCPHVELMEPRDYYSGGKAWEDRFAEDRKLGGRMFGVIVHDGKIVIDNHRDDDARTCPQLVAVVEAMGQAADGDLSELRVVEVPYGVAYDISDYDGIEHIAEQHRTWS